MAKGPFNPFRPGAGHMPPYLAGRGKEEEAFKTLLTQEVITQNLIITGLRGVGKTVLLTHLKPVAQAQGWLWAGTDLSETASLTEENIATRLIADLGPATSHLVVDTGQPEQQFGFHHGTDTVKHRLDHNTLVGIYRNAPGLVVDKLKAVLQATWQAVDASGKRGIVFAYDEAQTMSDHAKKEQYPLATLLQVFQSIQRDGVRFFLVLVGLPTLQSRLVDSRTYSERMFHVEILDRLSENDSRDAILVPLKDAEFSFAETSVETVVQTSGGYPYFIQFICREVCDQFIAGSDSVPSEDILAKLDADFFAGRWQQLTDRQRELLYVAASLPHAETEFTVQELTEMSATLLEKKFSPSHASQMLSALVDKGLVYKNRHGKYSFAVPLLDQFIARQYESH